MSDDTNSMQVTLPHTHAAITLRCDVTVTLPIQQLIDEDIDVESLVDGSTLLAGNDLLDVSTIRDQWENLGDIEIDDAYTYVEKGGDR